MIFRTVGIEPYWVEQQARHVPEVLSLHETYGRHLATDDPHILSRLVPVAYRETSPYVQEQLKPQGLTDIMGYRLLNTPARFAEIAVTKHERQGLITEREIELGALLLPHIRRAVTISNVLDAKTIERSRMAEALDALRCGVVLADARGAILHANEFGRAHAAQRRAGARGRGHPARQGSGRRDRIAAAIALAAQDEAGIGKTGLAIRLTEPDEPAIFAHVLPLTGSDLRTRLQPEAVAAVFIGAPPDEQDGAATTAAAYGLTPAETRVLANLLAGRTLNETAASLGVAPATAKTHLDSIFAKTGVTRQADLMRLATGLAPPTTSSR